MTAMDVSPLAVAAVYLGLLFGWLMWMLRPAAEARSLCQIAGCDKPWTKLFNGQPVCDLHHNALQKGELR